MFLVRLSSRAGCIFNHPVITPIPYIESFIVQILCLSTTKTWVQSIFCHASIDNLDLCSCILFSGLLAREAERVLWRLTISGFHICSIPSVCGPHRSKLSLQCLLLGRPVFGRGPVPLLCPDPHPRSACGMSLGASSQLEHRKSDPGSCRILDAPRCSSAQT